MTEQEAIKLLEIHRSFTNSSNADVKAIDMAISALEKQIAKKPDYIGPWFRCSNCKKGMGIPNYTINLDAHDYCHHCGQRIDWSEI